MNRAERNGIIVGLALGTYVIIQNWPFGVEASQSNYVRAAGQMFGAVLICWFIGRLIGKKSNRFP